MESRLRCCHCRGGPPPWLADPPSPWLGTPLRDGSLGRSAFALTKRTCFVFVKTDDFLRETGSERTDLIVLLLDGVRWFDYNLAWNCAGEKHWHVHLPNSTLASCSVVSILFWKITDTSSLARKKTRNAALYFWPLCCSLWSHVCCYRCCGDLSLCQDRHPQQLWHLWCDGLRKLECVAPCCFFMHFCAFMCTWLGSIAFWAQKKMFSTIWKCYETCRNVKTCMRQKQFCGEGVKKLAVLEIN